MRELSLYYPELTSVSIVPSGLTKFRDKLYPLSSFEKADAEAVIDMVNSFGEEHKKRHGSRLFFVADEFYLKAEREIPDADYYEDYPQIENGVGMLRSFYEEAAIYLDGVLEMPRPRRSVSVATGVASAPMLREISEKAAAKHGNLTSNIYELKNRWFGESITVSGLLTGHDIAEQLAGRDLGEVLLLPRNTLRAEGDLFLCGMSPDELSERLGVPILFIGEDGAAFVAALLGED